MSTIVTNEIQLGQDSVTLSNNCVIGISTPPGDLIFSSGISGNNTPVATLYSNGALTITELLPSTGTLSVGGNINLTDLSLEDITANNITANTVTINDYTMPGADGSANQIFQTDGAGNVTFADLPEGFTTGKAIAMAIVFG